MILWDNSLEMHCMGLIDNDQLFQELSLMNVGRLCGPTVMLIRSESLLLIDVVA